MSSPTRKPNGDDPVDTTGADPSASGAPVSSQRRVDEPERDIFPSAPQSSTKYLAGDVIARKYRLVRLLGEGGMGAVWLADNITLDVQVAIKLIRREIATAETSERLLQEARAAARLGHPSIVRVFDFGETEQEDPYIVMEVLHGESLGSILSRKGRLPATNAVRTLLPVASALATAHAKGIVHRDLKPDNILLVDAEGGAITPKLVDFGIAKFRRDGIQRGPTQAGTVVGSPDYMSPEQARGQEDVDERADVWAFSVVLYETITGSRPFDGPNYNALLTSIINDPPTPTVDYGAGDPELWQILEKGLAKKSAQRWQTMREIGVALANWAIDRGIVTDVAGGSLAAHWLVDAARMASNPSLVGDRLSLPDIGVLTPPSLRRADVATLAPPSPAFATPGVERTSTPAPGEPAPVEEAVAPPSPAAAPPTPAAAPAIGARGRLVWIGAALVVVLVAAVAVARAPPSPAPAADGASAPSAAVTRAEPTSAPSAGVAAPATAGPTAEPTASAASAPPDTTPAASAPAPHPGNAHPPGAPKTAKLPVPPRPTSAPAATTAQPGRVPDDPNF